MAEFDILSKGGISKIGGLFDVALEMEILSKSGSFYRYGEIMIGQGKEAGIGYLNENQKVLKEIEEKVWKEIKSGKVSEEKVIGVEASE